MVVLDTPEVVVISERLRGRGRGSGVEVDMEIFSTYWFDRDEIVKRRVFPNREEAIDAAERSE